MNNYSIFSQCYDELMGDRVADSEKIMGFIKEANIKGNDLLDVACGTGSALKYLFKAGLNVMGVDISDDMLNIAKNKLPNIHLEKMDMTELKIDKSFDIILSLYDSVNHLLSFNEWGKFFNGSYKHLKDGGILIFDINTLYKLKKLSHGDSFEKKVKNITIIMKVSNLDGDIFNWNTQILKNTNGLIEKYEENIKETSFEIEKIKNCLLEIFKNIKIVDNNGNEPTDNSKRVYFICKK